jgi:hypothetical protein
MSDFNEFLSSLSDDQKQKLLQALMSNNSSDKSVEPKKTNTQVNKKSSTPSVTVDENFIVKKTDSLNTRRREPVKGRFKNDWVDNGEFRDIETPNFEKTPRRREAAKKVDFECHVCGKSFKADPKFVYGEYHRCNRCTGK